MLAPQDIERVYRGQPALVNGSAVEDVLSPRQFDVASMTAEGKTYLETADEIGMSVYTVRTHIHAIYPKLGIFTSAGLAPFFPLEQDNALLEGKRLSDLEQCPAQLDILEAVSIGQHYKAIAAKRRTTTSTVRSHVSIVGEAWPDARGGLMSARVANGLRARAVPAIEASQATFFGQNYDIGRLTLSTVAELEPLIYQAGPRPVPPESGELIGLERQAIEATPTLVDTGSPEEFLDFLQKGGKPSTYIWHDQLGQKVGYLALVELEGSDDMEVRSVAVSPERQGAGFGKAMMAYAETAAKQHDKDRLTLVVHPDSSAVKFYEHLGYKLAKTVENYYGDGQPRYVLEKTLLTD